MNYVAVLFVAAITVLAAVLVVVVDGNSCRRDSAQEVKAAIATGCVTKIEKDNIEFDLPCLTNLRRTAASAPQP